MESEHSVSILVVRKTTNLEWYGTYVKEQVARGNLPPGDLDVLVHANREHYEALDRLRRALDQRAVVWAEAQRENDWPLGLQYDVVITVGGDGTLLAASHNLGEDTVIAGVKSSGTSVGHLCVAGIAGIDGLVESIVGGTYRTMRAARLMADVTHVARHGGAGQITTVPILNDFLYTNTNPAATTRYRLHVGDESEEQKSSGIWIATATGSTAAIMAAGGSIRPRSDRDFQYAVREVFRVGDRQPRLVRGMFDPDTGSIEIENRCESALLALDGQHGEVQLGLGDRIRFRRGPDLRMIV